MTNVFVVIDTLDKVVGVFFTRQAAEQAMRRHNLPCGISCGPLSPLVSA